MSSYNNGAGNTLFDMSQPGAYGTIDLPASGNSTGGSCSGNTNLGTPTNIKSELSDQLPANPLVVGGCLSVKSGAAQPSATRTRAATHRRAACRCGGRYQRMLPTPQWWSVEGSKLRGRAPHE